MRRTPCVYNLASDLAEAIADAIAGPGNFHDIARMSWIGRYYTRVDFERDAPVCNPNGHRSNGGNADSKSEPMAPQVFGAHFPTSFPSQPRNCLKLSPNVYAKKAI